MKSLARSFTEVEDSFSMTDFGTTMSLPLMNFMFDELRLHLMNFTHATFTVVLMTPCYFDNRFASFSPSQWTDSYTCTSTAAAKKSTAVASHWATLQSRLAILNDHFRYSPDISRCLLSVGVTLC